MDEAAAGVSGYGNVSDAVDDAEYEGEAALECGSEVCADVSETGVVE